MISIHTNGGPTTLTGILKTMVVYISADSRVPKITSLDIIQQKDLWAMGVPNEAHEGFRMQHGTKRRH